MGLTDKELEKLAEFIIEKTPHQQKACNVFTEDEVETIRGILKTKTMAAKAVLILFGTLMIWALKDIYIWIVAHIHWIGK